MFLLVFGLGHSFIIRALPSLTGIRYWREALAKFSLLAFGFPLLVRLACLLLGART
jgi:hypothetical protein